ncbi:hypothetical protein JB92DRAFT_2811742 [Gautieria morchelliformis]|nr:hypothetical protein JB92DRAFT_2811742 [Gautieria morchelliformis]
MPRGNVLSRFACEGGRLSAQELKAEFNALKGTTHYVLRRQRYTDESGTTRIIGGLYYPAGLAALPTSFPRSLPTPRPSYEIRDAPGKGLGVFATRNIAFGEIIVVERPLIVMPLLLLCSPGRTEAERKENTQLTIAALVASLNPDDRRTFFSLSNCKKTLDLGEIFGIIMTNAIKLPVPCVPETYACVCPTISRVNHSCGPNTAFTFDMKTFSMCLQAGRDIPVSTEITASYCTETLSRVERLRELDEKYDFTCTCSYCARPSAASDRARMELQNWEATHPTFKQWLATPNRDPDALLLSSARALLMIKKEGIEIGNSIVHYQNIAAVYAAKGDAAKMKYWLWKLILAHPLDDNRDVAVTRYVHWISDPEKNCPFWAVLAGA